MGTKLKKSSKAAKTAGRIVRKLAIVLGSACFGLGAGAVGAYLMLLVLFGPIKQDGWGAAPVWFFLMAVGGLLGLIAASVISIRSVMYEEIKFWTPFECLGLLLGSLAAAGITFLGFGRYYLFMQLIILATLLPALATAGRVFVARLLRKIAPESSQPQLKVTRRF